MTQRGRYFLKWALIVGVLAVFAAIYFVFNPGESGFFPRCLFKLTTGLDCPGCGSQRAIHHLLNLDLPGALRQNLLVVVAIPYLILGFIFDMTRNPSISMAVWRKRLFGTRAIIVVLVIIITFTVLRNLPFFAGYL